MKIEIEEKGINCGRILVTKDGDNKTNKESTFFYHLAKELSNMSFCGEKHFFRKEMAKDGHMVNNGVYYITNKDRSVRVYDANYAMRDSAECFDKGSTVDLVYDVLK